MVLLATTLFNLKCKDILFWVPYMAHQNNVNIGLWRRLQNRDIKQGNTFAEIR
jgi:hypothetical protein